MDLDEARVNEREKGPQTTSGCHLAIDQIVAAKQLALKNERSSKLFFPNVLRNKKNENVVK